MKHRRVLAVAFITVTLFSFGALAAAGEEPATLPPPIPGENNSPLVMSLNGHMGMPGKAAREAELNAEIPQSTSHAHILATSTKPLGIDVSMWQGAVNWPMVKNGGKAFAIVRASAGKNTTDTRFAANAPGAVAAGLVTGTYHFAYPEFFSPHDEAQKYLSVASSYIGRGFLPPVLDIEDSPTENSFPYRLGKTALSQWIRSWCAEVKQQTTVSPMIYTTRDYARNYFDSDLNQYLFWVATDGRSPDFDPGSMGIWSSWRLQQYWFGEKGGTAPGVNGPVDLDSFNGDLNGLLAWAQSGANGSSSPVPPTGLTATAVSASSIKVSWVDNSSNENSFIVYRWNGSTWSPVGTVGANTTSFTDSGLQPSTAYFHTVCAQNSAGSGCASTYTNATTQGSSTSTAPAAPSGLTATALSSSSIKISWTDNSYNENNFIVYRWNGSTWTQVGTVGANITSFTDSGLQPSTAYFHTVCAQNGAGSGCASTYTSATTQGSSTSTPPAAPSGLTATALSSSSIKVSWVDNSNNETGFIINRWNGSSWTQVGTVGANITTFTDTGLQPSTAYFHTVCAQNSAGTGCASTYTNATTQGSSTSTPPAAPSGLTATTLSSSSIKISWVDNSNNENGFIVYRWNGSSWTQIGTVGANTTSFTDSGLQPSTVYYHTVCAQNSAGSGCASTYTTARTSDSSSSNTTPTAPANVTATALSSSSIRVSWSDRSNNESNFIVYRWNGSTWMQVGIVGANVTSFTDPGLQPSTTYFHTVCAKNSAGSTCASTYSTATTTRF